MINLEPHKEFARQYPLLTAMLVLFALVTIGGYIVSPGFRQGFNSVVPGT